MSHQVSHRGRLFPEHSWKRVPSGRFFPEHSWKRVPSGTVLSGTLLESYIVSAAVSGKKNMRLFIAITLSEKMKDAISEIQEEMYARGVRGNYTPVENLHLTLAFIGDYPDPEAVLEAMEASLPETTTLELDGCGSFGKLWWAGLKTDEALKADSRRLRRALSDAGIPFDRKKFSPHITLIRKPVCREEALFASIPVPKAEMKVDYISLMRSDRGKSGMIYSEIGCVYCE